MTYLTKVFLRAHWVLASIFLVLTGSLATFFVIDNIFGSEVVVHGEELSVTNKEAEFFYKPLLHSEVTIPETGKAVLVDLGTMTLTLYQDSSIKEEYPIKSKGRPGSLWETPTGEYRVLTKEKNHFSSIGEVWMPYSIGFFGNFFIHGWPTYDSGNPVAEGFSGGCIRVETDYAELVYSFVDNATPIIVTDSSARRVGELGYLEIQKKDPPRISAESFLVADLDSGYVFVEKNRDEKRTIASITKLMSAVVSLEAVNQEKRIEINKSDLDIYGDSGSLEEGEVFTARNLLAPLLLSSSNDAAFALSRILGTNYFVRLMNEKASAIGLVNTHFSDPAGLGVENKSTTDDLLQLLRYIRDVHEPLLSISSRDQIKLPTNKSTHTWFNFNWESDDVTFVGGKVGYTDAAGKTMVSLFRLPMAEFTDRDIGIVVLGSDDNVSDIQKLRDWTVSNFVYGSTIEEVTSARVLPDIVEDERDIELLFVGDIMMDRGVESMVHAYGEGDYDYPLEHVSGMLRGADITFGNLEGPISDKGEQKGSIYSFRMNPAVVKTLYDSGFDVLSLANNHMGDYGHEALEDTFRRLTRAGISYSGAGWNKKEAETPVIIERGGKRVGYLAFSDVGPNWIRAGEASSGIAIATKELITRVIRQAEGSVDILVVSFHFGEEYETNSNTKQQFLAHAAIDAGANIVVGHHPHVSQEIETYKGGVIAYSLGNFIFDQAFSKDTSEGLVLQVIIGEGGKVKDVEPTYIDFNQRFQPKIRN